MKLTNFITLQLQNYHSNFIDKYLFYQIFLFLYFLTFILIFNLNKHRFFIRVLYSVYKDYFTNFYSIFKDHPSSTSPFLFSLSFEAFQSNWTGIIIDFTLLVKTLTLKFCLNFWICLSCYVFIAFLLRFFYFYLLFIVFCWLYSLLIFLLNCINHLFTFFVYHIFTLELYISCLLC